jgi:hypothetical protein
MPRWRASSERHHWFGGSSTAGWGRGVPGGATPVEHDVADALRPEAVAAFGWAQPVGVELFGDLGRAVAGGGELPDPVGQLRVVAELGQSGHRADQFSVAVVAAGPGDPGVHAFAVAEHGQLDTFDQAAHELLAVGVGGGVGVP